MFKPATNLDEVINCIKKIIADAIQNNNRAGYFASLYLKVTTSVKEGIDKRRFQNGSRMETLTVNFANRYLNSYDQWQKKENLSACWKLAYQETEKSSVLILEQLLLGMSAHINLDLGIATVKTQHENGTALQDIRNDFDAINSIIASLTYEAISELNKVSPFLSLLAMTGWS